MSPLRLSLQQARNLHLAAQGLLTTATVPASRVKVAQAIRRMHLLQIDTIHVVARSPYLVLFSRLGQYEPRWLDELLERGAIFETWAHEACFAPIDDYPLHRKNLQSKQHWGVRHGQRMLAEHGESMHSLLAHVRSKGPVKAADFERQEKGGSAWWGWKDEKKWLEAWFVMGDLMIARREHFHRVYDLTERVHPAGIDAPLPSEEALQTQFIEHAVTALGITQARWINDYFRTKPRYKDADLAGLCAAGRLVTVAVDGWDAPAYVHASNLTLVRKAARDQLLPTHGTVLSPFDPVVWDRERALAMFDFDYRIECYTPEPKRKFGYFVLPILVRGQLLGRLDAKAHRQDGVFEVKSLYLQDGVMPDAALATDIALALHRCAHWHQTPKLLLGKVHAKGFKVILAAAIKATTLLR
jgi:uncharacterized protein YcaQ